MSATPTAAGAPATGAADPSMEDILASIRRILSEDEAEPPAAATPAAPPPQAAPDVLALDTSMLVTPPPAPAPPMPAPVPVPAPAPMAMAPPPEPAGMDAPLLGSAASSAAMSSVGSLLRTLGAERQPVAVYRSGGVTIEDVVREEMRPLLKEWLDSNLPPMVERLVRAEIERVVGRAAS